LYLGIKTRVKKNNLVIKISSWNRTIASKNTMLILFLSY